MKVLKIFLGLKWKEIRNWEGTIPFSVGIGGYIIAYIINKLWVFSEYRCYTTYDGEYHQKLRGGFDLFMREYFVPLAFLVAAFWIGVLLFLIYKALIKFWECIKDNWQEAKKIAKENT